LDIEAAIRGEQTALRTELQELKKCQLQYFLFSIAGSGAVFGVMNALPSSNSARAALLLAPLVIVLPCWVTFFDKATTITRLTGYMQYLELQFSIRHPNYIGYERALDHFRRMERQHPPKRVGFLSVRKWPAFLALLAIRTRHRYWLVNWWTFLILSSAACALPTVFWNNEDKTAVEALPMGWLAVAVVSIVALYTLRIVIKLTLGEYSTREVAAYWRKILP
jgi:hypothetical protein